MNDELAKERARVVAKLKRARLFFVGEQQRRGIDYAIRVIEAMRTPSTRSPESPVLGSLP